MVDERPHDDEPTGNRSQNARNQTEIFKFLRLDPNQSTKTQLSVLKIELRRIRQEASAARLDARAAEIEMLIEKLSRQDSLVAPGHRSENASSILDQHSRDDSVSQTGEQSSRLGLPRRFESWDEVRAVQRQQQHLAIRTQPRYRFDAASQPRPHLDCPVPIDGPDQGILQPVEKAADEAQAVLESRLEKPEDTIVDNESRSDDRSKKKSRPLAMIISTIVHIVVLLLLAGWTLSSPRPKDQVAMTASPATTSEMPLETFTFETSEPQIASIEPAQSETEYELTPVAEIAIAEFSLDVMSAPASPNLASMLSGGGANAPAATSLSSVSDAKMQFCGVEGGGNHFVYLVDSSVSMGAGFDSARRELLNSIEFLKSDQRFYVIFFDAEPDFMRLTNSSVDEPRSVEATGENKLALKRWAMQIQQDRGRNPYEVLEFALTLKPDVVFLLSDGEFPQRIEDLLLEKNRIKNLFGDNGPMCIVHTIAYYSKEGESRMRRIAEKNGGQYRYVPKP